MTVTSTAAAGIGRVSRDVWRAGIITARTEMHDGHDKSPGAFEVDLRGLDITDANFRDSTANHEDLKRVKQVAIKTYTSMSIKVAHELRITKMGAPYAIHPLSTLYSWQYRKTHQILPNSSTL